MVTRPLDDATWPDFAALVLHNGTVAMFERHSFERTRQIGKHHWVVSRIVRP